MVKVTPERIQMAQAVKAHAVQNYEVDGWDIVVEAYTTEELVQAIGWATTLKGAIKKVREHVAPIADYRNEIIAA